MTRSQKLPVNYFEWVEELSKLDQSIRTLLSNNKILFKKFDGNRNEKDKSKNE